MEPNPGIAAVRKLAHLGYRFTVNGQTIKAKYEGEGDLDPVQVRSLVDAIRAHKPVVVDFLKTYCPRCGGVFFGTFSGVSRCMGCYFNELAELNPGLRIQH